MKTIGLILIVSLVVSIVGGVAFLVFFLLSCANEGRFDGLDWRDAKNIVLTADQMLYEDEWKTGERGEQSYYEEVLKRVKEGR